MTKRIQTSWDKMISETRGKASGAGAERTDTGPRNAVTEEAKKLEQPEPTGKRSHCLLQALVAPAPWLSSSCVGLHRENQGWY